MKTGDQVKPVVTHYEFIGNFEADNHQQLFIDFQNIDGQHKMVTQGMGQRSMMVGDVLIDYDNSKGYLCRPFGWLEFNPHEFGFALSGKG